jgi:hypothetical protein
MGGNVQLRPRQPCGVSALLCLPLKKQGDEETACQLK